MNGVDGIESDALQAGGHRFDPGHVHQSFLALRHVQRSCIGRMSTQMSTLAVTRPEMVRVLIATSEPT
jgi:hypothetical protein